eukprot:5260692-Pleurochrysis_carterae.AAC.1
MASLNTPCESHFALSTQRDPICYSLLLFLICCSFRPESSGTSHSGRRPHVRRAALYAQADNKEQIRRQVPVAARCRAAKSSRHRERHDG